MHYYECFFFSVSAFLWCYELIISYWSVCPSVCSSICCPFVSPSDFLPTRPSTRLSVSRPIRMSVCPFLSLSNHSPVFLLFVCPSSLSVRRLPVCHLYVRAAGYVLMLVSMYLGNRMYMPQNQQSPAVYHDIEGRDIGTSLSHMFIVTKKILIYFAKSEVKRQSLVNTVRVL